MHLLEAKIRAIRRRLRFWLLLEAVARLSARTVAGTVLLGLVDYWFRFHEPGLRMLISLGFFGLVGWGLYQLARSAAWKPISEVGLALRLEECFPALADRLGSSLSFLRETRKDPTAGSAVLRELVINQTAEEAARLDFRRALDPRPLWRALSMAGAMLILVTVLTVADPNSARIALARLALPWGKTAWPQRTQLILLPRVERIARGEPFYLLVDEVHGKLPSDLRIHYRLETPEGIQEQTEPVRLVSLRSETGQWKQLGQVRREGLVRPFWYRVTGGDDTGMHWIRVEVLEPPSLVSCQVRVIPPEYSGLPVETAGQWIRALVGSRVEISGRADRPLRAAVLITEQDHPYQAHILEDGHGFQIGVPSTAGSGKKEDKPVTSQGIAASEKPRPTPSEASSQQQPPSDHQASFPEMHGGIFIRQSGRWRLRLIDQQGLEQEVASWEVRSLPDLPPSLTVVQPPVLTYATPKAVLPIRAIVKDDLGVRQVLLLAGLGESSSAPMPSDATPTQLPTMSPNSSFGPEKPPAGLRQWWVYEGPKQPPKATKPLSTPSDLTHSLLELEYSWDLGSLEAQPGSQIVFYLQASDYAGQTVSTQAHRIVLLTAEQFLDRLTALQNALFAELAQWLQKHRSVHEQLGELEKAFADGQQLSQRHLDRLRSLELGHRQLVDQLGKSPESILNRLGKGLADLEQNHLGQTEIRRRLAYLHSELLRLEQKHLSIISQEWIRAIKLAQAALDSSTTEKAMPPPQTLRDSLGQVLAHQQEVIRTLDSWLQRFRPGLQTQRFYQEIAQLIREQKAVLEQIRHIAQRTLTKEVLELSTQEQADLRSAAQRQTELAQRTEQLQQEMNDALQELQPIDPISAQVLAEAVRYAQETSPAIRMKTAAQDILQNRMGQLLQTLPEILRHLEHLSQLLANRQSQPPGRLIPMLEQTEQILTDCIKRQQHIDSLLQLAVQAKPNDQAALLQQAAADQQGLLEEVQKLLGQMEQWWAGQPAQAIRSALEAMHQTSQSARQGQPRQAIRSSQAALQALQQARQLLAEERIQIQIALLSQQLAQLREALPGLHQRQEALWKETIRLEDVRKHIGTLDLQDQARLDELARQQQDLYSQTHSWTEKLGQQEVLQMVLQEAAHWMQQAAQQLAQGQTGPPVQQAQQEALAQIRLLQQALGEEMSEAMLAKPLPAPSPPPASTSPRKMISAAELRVLRLWQESIHERTVQFHRTFGDQPPDRPEVQAQFQALRQTQARLAQMVEQILRSGMAEENKP
ncbi:MAG: hypothetical protein NZ602_06875 [Thermoguttaceae bacterium]|nr:hypothetical protein [Thermoguttaceae bacterium]MDW8038515.1 hypothetical protein [Thermoguttaceae bacterium]